MIGQEGNRMRPPCVALVVRDAMPARMAAGIPIGGSGGLGVNLERKRAIPSFMPRMGVMGLLEGCHNQIISTLLVRVKG